MKFVSWNVNGLRAVLKKDFYQIFDTLGADVFALQETKCRPGQVELDLPDYGQYFSSAERKGYSGTAVFTRETPIRVLHGIGNDYLDKEGRVVAVELDDIWFVDVYTPNAQLELARIDHRMQWDDEFRDFCKGLEEGVIPGGIPIERPREEPSAEALDYMLTRDVDAIYDGMEHTSDPEPGGNPSAAKPVVICGDFNVAHKEIDLAHPDNHRGSAGFSDEERGKFDQLLDAGFVDTFRLLHPDLADKYTWWSYKYRARRTNAGWRIDYFLVSEALASKVESATIYDEVEGSDHCPIGLTLSLD